MISCVANICREVIANAYWIGVLNGVSDKPRQLGYLVKARIENRKRPIDRLPIDRLTCDYIRTFLLSREPTIHFVCAI